VGGAVYTSLLIVSRDKKAHSKLQLHVWLDLDSTDGESLNCILGGVWLEGLKISL
jgi:hypothetical protein